MEKIVKQRIRELERELRSMKMKRDILREVVVILGQRLNEIALQRRPPGDLATRSNSKGTGYQQAGLSHMGPSPTC